LKRALSGFALALGLGFAAAASAGTVEFDVTSVGFPIYDTVTLSSATPVPGTTYTGSNEYAGPIILNGTVNGQKVSVVAFCVDLFHNISVNFGGTLNEKLTYQITPYTHDNSQGPDQGNTLSSTVLDNISGLAELGAAIYNNRANDPNAAYELPAISAAIWAEEYGLTASFGNSAENGYLATYLTESFGPPPAPGLLSENSQGFSLGVQSFVAGGVVPEPSTWAMLILGVAMIGFAARRRGLAVAA
jgi:hypothetical protein